MSQTYMIISNMSDGLLTIPKCGSIHH